MKPKFILIPFFVFSVWAQAQNLVPNPSFEDTACTYIPGGDPTFFGAAHWYNPNNATPDYWGIEAIPGCVSSIFAAVPYGEWQLPRTGGKMAALYATIANSCSRDYIQVELDESLNADSTYCVSMYVSLSNRSLICTDCMGIYFSESELLNLDGHCDFGVSPHIANPIGVLLDDTLSWTEISGLYTAIGGEKFLTVGNMLPDDSCIIESVNGNDPTFNIAYYFIDDVSVTPCPVVTNIDNSSRKDILSVFPVPARETLNISGNETGILRIYDITGHMVYSTTKSQKEVQINLNGISSGIYILQFWFGNGKNISMKIVKE